MFLCMGYYKPETELASQARGYLGSMEIQLVFPPSLLIVWHRLHIPPSPPAKQQWSISSYIDHSERVRWVVLFVFWHCQLLTCHTLAMLTPMCHFCSCFPILENCFLFDVDIVIQQWLNEGWLLMTFADRWVTCLRLQLQTLFHKTVSRPDTWHRCLAKRQMLSLLSCRTRYVVWRKIDYLSLQKWEEEKMSVVSACDKDHS